MQQNVNIIDAIHFTGVFHAIINRIAITVRVGKRIRNPGVLQKARPNHSSPTTGSYLTPCGDPMGIDPSILTLQYREK